MKTLQLLSTFVGIFLITSCKQESTQVASDDKNRTTESFDTLASSNLWAEQVESSINLTVPDDWSPEDWNNIFKKVDRKKIYKDVVDAVLSGKQIAYNFFTDSILRVDQVKAKLHKTKTFMLIDTVTNKTEQKNISINIGPEHISLMRIREKIYFNKETFKLTRIPTALILYINHHSEDGTFVGYEPLFYVKLNN